MNDSLKRQGESRVISLGNKHVLSPWSRSCSVEMNVRAIESFLWFGANNQFRFINFDFIDNKLSYLNATPVK